MSIGLQHQIELLKTETEANMKLLQMNMERHESKTDATLQELKATAAKLETNVYRTFVAAIVVLTAVLSLGVAFIAFLPS